jgi:hypothetical protein
VVLGFQGGYKVVKEAVRELARRSQEVFMPLSHPTDWTTPSSSRRRSRPEPFGDQPSRHDPVADRVATLTGADHLLLGISEGWRRHDDARVGRRHACPPRPGLKSAHWNNVIPNVEIQQRRVFSIIHQQIEAQDFPEKETDRAIRSRVIFGDNRSGE